MNDTATIEEKQDYVRDLLDQIHPVLAGEAIEFVQNLAILMLRISVVDAGADERRALVDSVRVNLLGAAGLH
jgi:hypothetical protein